MTDVERALLEALRRTYPGGLAWRPDTEGDLEAQALAARLLAAGLVERTEEEGVTRSGEFERCAVYRLADEFTAEFGATPNPELN